MGTFPTVIGFAFEKSWLWWICVSKSERAKRGNIHEMQTAD